MRVKVTQECVDAIAARSLRDGSQAFRSTLHNGTIELSDDVFKILLDRREQGETISDVIIRSVRGE